MHLSTCLFSGIFILLSYAHNVPHKAQYSTHNYYVLEHDPRASASLTDVATALGVEVVQKAGELRNHWLVRTPKSSTSDRDAVVDNYHAIQAHATYLDPRSTEVLRARRIATSVRSLHPQTLRQRTKRAGYDVARAPPPIRPSPQDNLSAAHELAIRLHINDPIFVEQWHIVNEDYPEHMMNVTPVWEEGITGKGVYVAMVDDGIDDEHEDIKDNFFAEGSYDFNDHEPLAKPKLSDDHHGTRCAGEISAVKNDVCGVGMAYNSKIAGLRILSGPISDIDEAHALNYGYQNTSIYSCSWGPPDDGRSMEAPSLLIQKAVVEGIVNGRQGKGSIFVFASGNGAASGDQCNFDGYTNSIFSVTIAAVDYKGLHPYYSEPCASNLVVAYSSGSSKNIHTTDIKGKCTSYHGGTSAAAPLASGVFALALEARPDLTWRDVQHLCIRSAMTINPDDQDWEATATGRNYSYKYGYGKLDAWQYVNAARTWKLVKPQTWIVLPISELGDGKVDKNGAMLGGIPIGSGGVQDTLTVTRELLLKGNFEKLEHITVTVWINHTRRGDVEVELHSPNGVTSVLGAARKYDSDANGYPGWTFMTVKHWDENPVGTWTISVHDQNVKERSGKFLGWTMSLFGSCIDASRAVPYELPTVTPSPGNPLPPQSPAIPQNTTKSYPKPTAHLPGDHGEATGEAENPSFTLADSLNPSISATPDQGYFKGMSLLVSNSAWLFGAVGLVVLFGCAAGVYFWRRRKLRSGYATVALGEDVPMMDRGSRPASSRRPDVGRTKELYDAFGVVSDDEADEEAALRKSEDSIAPADLGFHSGFLEDDDPQSATASLPYRDEPTDLERAAESGRGEPSGGSGSGDDGSWEHASQQV